MTDERGNDEILDEKGGLYIPEQQVGDEATRLATEDERLAMAKEADNEEGPEYPERPPAIATPDEDD